jgi:hypothetical protein
MDATEPRRQERLSGPVESTALCPDGHQLAVATFVHHQVFAWDLRAGR